MKIKALVSTPDNVGGSFHEWEVDAAEIISDTLKRELKPEFFKGHSIRVISQGRILTVASGWMSATGGLLTDGSVVHVYIRDAPGMGEGSPEENRVRPPRSDAAIWSTVSVLRVQRVLAHDHPGVLFCMLISFTLSIIWWIKISNPRMLDAFSSFILYSATAAMGLVIFDKITRLLQTTNTVATNSSTPE